MYHALISLKLIQKMRFYLKKELGVKIGIAFVVTIILGATISTMSSPVVEPDDSDLVPSGKRGLNERSGRVRRKVPSFPPPPEQEEAETSTFGITQSKASTSVKTADENESEESAVIRRGVTTTTTTTTTTEAWKVLKLKVSGKTTSKGTTEVPASQKGTTEVPVGQEKSLDQDSSWVTSPWVILVILMSVVVLLLLVILTIISTACAVNATRLRGIRHHLGNVGAEMSSLVNQDLFWHLQAVAPEDSRFRSQRYSHGPRIKSYQASSRLNEMTPGATAFVPTHTATISKAAGRAYGERAKARESFESFKSVQNSEVNMSEVRLSDPTTEL